MKVDRAFLLASYSHPSAVRTYTRAVGRVGLWKSEKRFFGKHFRPEERLLDLGCGAGRTTFGLHADGYTRLLGADLSPELVRHARLLASRRKLRIRFRVADACRLPFESKSFEGCLFSFNGLMTIPRRSRRIAALREIRRLLVPGGRFVFTTHERLDDAAARAVWRKEKALWRTGRQDPQLHEFGDELHDELGRPAFIHVPDRREILDCLKAAKLEWIEDEFPNLAGESKAVREFVTFKCRFWAAQRPTSGAPASPSRRS